MIPIRPTLAAAFLCLSAGLCPAATVDGHTSLVVFGDSLSDTGNLFAATGGTVPGLPYVNGRFSNGQIWADLATAEFTDAGLFAASFAFGSANAVTNGDAIPDLGAQIGIFGATVPATTLGTNPLAALWFGANDLFDALDTLDQNGVVATGIAATQAVAAGIGALATGGITDFVVFNLPDLGRIPAYALFEPAKAAAATAGTLAFNAALDTEIGLLRQSGLSVTRIDTYALFNALLADPSAFGVTNATTPCYIPGVVVCNLADAPSLGFFDPVHPSTTIHRAIAEAFDAGLGLAAVPLPASGVLLGLAIMAVGALRRRRPI